MSETDIPPFALLLRDYAFAYTASHDFDVCDRLMVEDYVLRMGDAEIRGRDEAYKPATQRQYRQYPGLGFTVHDLITDGDRAALHFSEHGRSVLTGALTSWQGVSLYRWDGTRLTECRVEQDYYARRRQAESGDPHPVLPPGLDPWCRPAVEGSPATETAVRSWLESGDVLHSDAVTFDDEDIAGRERPAMADAVVEVLDLFSSGDRSAFHIRVDGTYAGGLGHESAPAVGRSGSLFISGLVTATPEGIAGRAVSDRLPFSRRLARES